MKSLTYLIPKEAANSVVCSHHGLWRLIIRSYHNYNKCQLYFFRLRIHV